MTELLIFSAAVIVVFMYVIGWALCRMAAMCDREDEER